MMVLEPTAQQNLQPQDERRAERSNPPVEKNIVMEEIMGHFMPEKIGQ